MSEWWTYRLSDFLMFSPATYWRLVERYNRDVWPLQLLTILAGALLLWWVAGRRPAAMRVLAVVLAPMWLWVAWSFHWQHYAPINWAAEYFAIAFAVQALLLAFAIPHGGDAFAGPLVRFGGLALACIGVFLYPLVAPATGRPWSQAEVLGVMPGPTAMVTLGVLIAARPRLRWITVIPALAVLAELTTRWVLQR